MRMFYTALVMVAVATASFAIGRSISVPGPGAALTTENLASVEVDELQSASGKLPAMDIDTPY